MQMTSSSLRQDGRSSKLRKSTHRMTDGDESSVHDENKMLDVFGLQGFPKIDRWA